MSKSYEQLLPIRDPDPTVNFGSPRHSHEAPDRTAETRFDTRCTLPRAVAALAIGPRATSPVEGRGTTPVRLHARRLRHPAGAIVLSVLMPTIG